MLTLDANSFVNYVEGGKFAAGSIYTYPRNLVRRIMPEFNADATKGKQTIEGARAEFKKELFDFIRSFPGTYIVELLPNLHASNDKACTVTVEAAKKDDHSLGGSTSTALSVADFNERLKAELEKQKLEFEIEKLQKEKEKLAADDDDDDDDREPSEAESLVIGLLKGILSTQQQKKVVLQGVKNDPIVMAEKKGFDFWETSEQPEAATEPGAETVVSEVTQAEIDQYSPEVQNSLGRFVQAYGMKNTSDILKILSENPEVLNHVAVFIQLYGVKRTGVVFGKMANKVKSDKGVLDMLEKFL